MKVQSERSGERISIAMPIQVFGTEITGQDFMEMTQTQVLCRDGAAIVSSHRLAPMQQITVRNLATGVEAPARIIGEMNSRPECRVYGIALLDPEFRLWNINFPWSADSENARFQRWLECNACQGRELAFLTALEWDVFQANRQLTRRCKWCGEDTVWRLAAHEASGDKRKLSEPPAKAAVQPPPDSSKERPSRKHARVQMKMAGCVREPGFGVDDFVQIENVSRGGLSFFSPNAYRPGALLEVAAPYMDGAENVFSPARVERVQALLGKNLNLYAVSFVKKTGQ
jgi:PilZ domain